ncbi:MAG: LytTR family transcriptional regulator DNA-binding domain-containing protein [Lachnospiraceae bacterium]|nr:LytTR family transcriptional regulator DNA-binding domain-containing protein [Lachnospiraceae bacterium]
MDRKTDIRIEIDPSCSDPQVIIKTAGKSELADRIKKAIEACLDGEYSQVLVYDHDTVIQLPQWDIIRVYTENRKICVKAEKGIYESRANLRELEEILDQKSFVRISRFEIINLRKVTSFDLSITGTIRVSFEDGSDTWVARRYVRTIQEKLKAGRGGESR